LSGAGTITRMSELSRLARIWPQWWNKSTLKTLIRKVPSGRKTMINVVYEEEREGTRPAIIDDKILRRAGREII
jgi:hypothetical protein